MIILPGTRIINSNDSKKSFGTVGGPVTLAGKQYLITCFHCVYNIPMKWTDTEPTSNNVISFFHNNRYTPFGKATKTLRTNMLDLAFIELDAGFTASKDIPHFGTIAGPKILTFKDEGKAWVRKFGAATNDTYGRFVGINSHFAALYPGQFRFHYFDNLLKFNTPGGQPFSKEGDSGSLIVDPANNVTGVIVAVNNEYTYAMSISAIILKFNLTF